MKLATALAVGLLIVALSAWVLFRGQRRPNLIIIAIDTLRTDALGCYGADGNPTPNLDRFARRATQFHRATASACWTLPSFASMFTGLYPEAHGAMQATDSLASSQITFAELLRDGGYSTAALTAGGFLSPRFGLQQGFDLFDHETESGKFREKIPKALQWLGDQGDTPFLLLLHGYDVHSPYAPDVRPAPPDGYSPPPDNFFRQVIRLANEGSSADTLDLGKLQTSYLTIDPPNSGALQRFRAAYQKLSESLAQPINTIWSRSPRFASELGWVRANYEAEVRQLDRDLGVLLDGIAESAIANNTIIIVVSDHGESFMEHGECDHQVVDEVVASIPLLVFVPGTEARRSDVTVRGLDLFPTLLDLCGIEWSGFTQGVSLAPLLEGKTVDNRPAACFQNVVSRNRNPEASLRLDDWKLVVGGRGTTSESPERLYDLAADPEEHSDVAKDHPRRVSRLGAMLARIRERSSRFRSLHAASGANLDDDAIRELTELGYLELIDDGER